LKGLYTYSAPAKAKPTATGDKYRDMWRIKATTQAHNRDVARPTTQKFGKSRPRSAGARPRGAGRVPPARPLSPTTPRPFRLSGKIGRERPPAPPLPAEKPVGTAPMMVPRGPISRMVLKATGLLPPCGRQAAVCEVEQRLMRALGTGESSVAVTEVSAGSPAVVRLTLAAGTSVSFSDMQAAIGQVAQEVEAPGWSEFLDAATIQALPRVREAFVWHCADVVDVWQTGRPGHMLESDPFAIQGFDNLSLKLCPLGSTGAGLGADGWPQVGIWLHRSPPRVPQFAFCFVVGNTFRGPYGLVDGQWVAGCGATFSHQLAAGAVDDNGALPIGLEVFPAVKTQDHAVAVARFSPVAAGRPRQRRVVPPAIVPRNVERGPTAVDDAQRLAALAAAIASSAAQPANERAEHEEVVDVGPALASHSADHSVMSLDGAESLVAEDAIHSSIAQAMQSV